MTEWKQQRQAEIETKRKQNLVETEERNNELKQAKLANNPWVRIVDNCEMQAGSYVGGKDVSRMRQAMIARKADITKKGSMKKAL